MRKNLLLLTLSTIFALLLLEGAIGLGTNIGLFRIRVPTYSIDKAHSRQFWRDMNTDFGVWHPSNLVYRHTRSCFDVPYRSNSHGARDPERALQSQRPRVVVLGDSFIEGWGVTDADRLTNVLERDTGIEHLNFATAANFGVTQYYLLYKALASRFTHTAVIIGMLPANDFWDDDYAFGQQAHSNRYRPYLIGEYPNYRLVYHQATLEQSAMRDRAGWLGFAQRLLAEFTYSYNAFAYFKLLLATQGDPAAAGTRAPPETGALGAPLPLDRSRPYSGFYDYRQDQLDRAKYAFGQIKKLAAGRSVVIVLLPTLADFKRYDPSKPPTLSVELDKFATANGMQLVDLLPSMHAHTKNWDSYILPCDGHWNAEGHAVAARYLKEKLTSLLGDSLAPRPAR